MRIIDIPEFRDRKAVLEFSPETPVLEACKKMADHNYGSCVVTVRGMIVGIFTERDLLVKVAGKGIDFKKLTLGDVMTPNPKTAHVDDSVIDSLRRMNSGRFRHLPIVDDQAHVIGIVSQGDFVAVTWGQLFHRISQHTRSSFEQYIQIWLVLLGVLTYTMALIWAIKTL
jgi:CBS domain-containing protein